MHLDLTLCTGMAVDRCISWGIARLPVLLLLVRM